MDNNEAREMDYADAATGPDPLDIDHCDACGFDLGTHHPTCPTIEQNPNRPTPDEWCWNCGNSPCNWQDDDGSCWRHTQPFTPQYAVTAMLLGAADKFPSMTDDQVLNMIATSAIVEAAQHRLWMKS